jgi:hypothetical protein
VFLITPIGGHRPANVWGRSPVVVAVARAGDERRTAGGGRRGGRGRRAAEALAGGRDVMSFSGSIEIPKQPNRITSQPLDPAGTGVCVCVFCLGIVQGPNEISSVRGK